MHSKQSFRRSISDCFRLLIVWPLPAINASDVQVLHFECILFLQLRRSARKMLAISQRSLHADNLLRIKAIKWDEVAEYNEQICEDSKPNNCMTIFCLNADKTEIGKKVKV